MNRRLPSRQAVLGSAAAILVPIVAYRTWTKQTGLSSGLLFVAAVSVLLVLLVEALLRRLAPPAAAERLRLALTGLVLASAVYRALRWGAWRTLDGALFLAVAGAAAVALLRPTGVFEPALAAARRWWQRRPRPTAAWRSPGRRSLLLVGVLFAAIGGVRLQRGLLDGVTASVLLLGLCLLAVLAVEAAMRTLALEAGLRVNLRLLIVTTLALLLGLEAGLRVATRRYHTYMESNGGPYASRFTPEGRGWFHVYRNRALRVVKTEFTHVRDISSLGLTDGELGGAKAPGEFRILALGDSYTEGVGTGPDSTWVRVAERHLSGRLPGRRIAAYNAGVSGSDVCFGYILYKEQLQSFQPDLVIAAVNTSDVADMLIRGGMERFRPGGSLAYREPPSWEKAYAVSYLWRLVVHELLGYDLNFVQRSRLEAELERAVGDLGAALRALEGLCRERGARLLVVFHPMELEVVQARYHYPGFSRLVAEWRSNARPAAIDLLDEYVGRGLIHAKNSRRFYWKLDLHHNTEGYAVMGRTIAARVAEMALLD